MEIEGRIDRRSYLLGYQDGREQVPSKVKETCKWKPEEYWEMDVYFLTSCDESACFGEGNIQDNQYKFCPYCGKTIEEILIEE